MSTPLVNHSPFKTLADEASPWNEPRIHLVKTGTVFLCAALACAIFYRTSGFANAAKLSQKQIIYLAAGTPSAFFGVGAYVVAYFADTTGDQVRDAHDLQVSTTTADEIKIWLMQVPRALYISKDSLLNLSFFPEADLSENTSDHILENRSTRIYALYLDAKDITLSDVYADNTILQGAYKVFFDRVITKADAAINPKAFYLGFKNQTSTVRLNRAIILSDTDFDLKFISTQTDDQKTSA